jgi:dethiobiotin synthetase
VGVYKPVASDCVSDGRNLISEDAFALWEAANQPLSLDAVCPQRYQAPLAPHLSARTAGRELDSELLRNGISVWTDACDIIIVEGAGGLMSPISDDEYFADLAYEFGYPVVIVAPNMIGVINQTLQSLITAACFRNGLNVAGVVLNDARRFDGDASMESNREQIASRSLAPVISRMRYNSDAFDDEIDWLEIARTVKMDSDDGAAKVIAL